MSHPVARENKGTCGQRRRCYQTADRHVRKPKRSTPLGLRRASGWVTTEAYETLVGRILAGLLTEGPFDGVYLCLHGATAVRGVPRPEAELARRVREVVGPRAVIAATFDLHGNEDEAFLRHADQAFAVKYFPHYDEARTLIRAVKATTSRRTYF
jgi:microcystin degradation protein MlrC